MIEGLIQDRIVTRHELDMLDAFFPIKRTKSKLSGKDLVKAKEQALGEVGYLVKKGYIK